MNEGCPLLDVQAGPMQKLCGSNYPLSIAFIVVNEFCERFSYYGMRAVLTLYFISFFHWDENLSTAVYHAFSALCYFTPVIGAIMADSWLGKYKTIIYLSIVYVVGHLIKSVGAIPSLGNQAVHVVLSMVGLFLIALGTGGIKPCVSAFGGDQFEEEHTSERSKFFSVFYLSINAGSLISTFVTPVLRGDVKCFGEDCYALAFGVPAALMVLALVVFIAGSGLYRKTPPQGNVLLEVCKCIGFAIKNRLKNRSRQIPRRDHWLDWASEQYSKQLIAEVKMVTRVLFLFLPLPMFWALFDQQGSRWTLQATKMNADFGIYVLQPDQMQFLNPLLILVFIPIFDLGLYPLINMCKFNFTPIRKMATGMILAGMAFGLAAIVEVKINETDMPQLVPKESLIQVLNLAKNPVQVTIQDQNLFQQPVEAFQNPDEYSRLILNGEQQSLHFILQHQGSSLAFNYTVKEKSVYSLIVFEAEGSLSSRLITDLKTKPENGLAAVRFINGLSQDVNLTIDSKQFISVQRNCDVSGYSLVERDTYDNGKCITETGEFTLDLGLLDFGASYTVVITNQVTGSIKVPHRLFLTPVKKAACHFAINLEDLVAQEVAGIFSCCAVGVSLLPTGLDVAEIRPTVSLPGVCRCGSDVEVRRHQSQQRPYGLAITTILINICWRSDVLHYGSGLLLFSVSSQHEVSAASRLAAHSGCWEYPCACCCPGCTYGTVG
ncbi:solute carrier family 15 member 2 isoform X6 [Lagopus muta]|uniref:solute carrier family 15 member 2 isoform X6 n=1 Tax=Lagopus muta TaxID=64668 RepID=UPI00209EBDF5|nr:solute carrier family 15 member 2 isoform X6 [Lagopus muta]XP_048809815.1 solute carrier family 15 member 2 isoform X6 [Lagopus muta]